MDGSRREPWASCRARHRLSARKYTSNPPLLVHVSIFDRLLVDTQWLWGCEANTLACVTHGGYLDAALLQPKTQPIELDGISMNIFHNRKM